MTATGHVVGAWYVSTDHHMAYRVEGTCTIWELAPDAGVSCRWANGTLTMTQSPLHGDAMFCEDCWDSRRTPRTARTAKSGAALTAASLP